MGLNLRLSIFVLLIQVSLAVWQRVTILRGRTLNLDCPIVDGHKTHVEWRNPEGKIMFFNRKTVLRDRRYSINKLTQYSFSISISDITFKDGGNYTCSQYHHPPIEKTVEVTVIGPPRISVTRHDGKSFVKCSAESNSSPARLSWVLDQGPEISTGQTNYRLYSKYVSESMIEVQAGEGRVTLKCVARHPALHSRPLMNFVKVGQSSKSTATTTTHSAAISSPTVAPQGSAGVPGGTTGGLEPGRTAAPFTPGDAATRPVSESSTVSSLQPHVFNDQQTLTTTTGFPPHSEHQRTTGWTSGNETVEDDTSTNITKRNETGGFDSDMQIGTQNKSTLLVFLVTCLIVGLLVVVIFFAIKLRRAHIAWRRENEDSDPSEESSKSKTSQEEKNSQGHTRRGLFNTVFAKYVVEEPTVGVSQPNTAPHTETASANQEHATQPAPVQPSAKKDLKETSL